MISTKEEAIISPIQTEEDLRQAAHCLSEAFGRQINDGVWTRMNPGWDTPEGHEKQCERLIKQWKSTNTNKTGKPNTIYLKATLPDPQNNGERRVAGFAIWKQISFVDGYGDAFDGDMTEPLKDLDETNRRFADQMFRSLWKRRIEYAREVSAAGSGRDPPAIFVLDCCAVDPAFQRRGLAGKLVEAGLEEAKQRGDLECTTEASVMGRVVYRRLGFKDEGVGDIQWDVDEEFKSWEKPPNVFLRTRA